MLQSRGYILASPNIEHRPKTGSYFTFSLHCQKYIQAKIMFLPSIKKVYLDQYKWTQRNNLYSTWDTSPRNHCSGCLTATWVTPTQSKRLQSQPIITIRASLGSKKPTLLKMERHTLRTVSLLTYLGHERLYNYFKLNRFLALPFSKWLTNDVENSHTKNVYCI